MASRLKKHRSTATNSAGRNAKPRARSTSSFQRRSLSQGRAFAQQLHDCDHHVDDGPRRYRDDDCKNRHLFRAFARRLHDEFATEIVKSAAGRTFVAIIGRGKPAPFSEARMKKVIRHGKCPLAGHGSTRRFHTAVIHSLDRSTTYHLTAIEHDESLARVPHSRAAR